MTERVLHPEFREYNAETNYPFGDHATLLADTHQPLNVDTFLDAVVFAIGLQPGAYLSRITVRAETVTIYIGDTSNSRRCSGVFNPRNPPDTLKLTDTYGRPAGALISSTDRLSIFQTWAIGEHNFPQLATEFVPAVVIPTPQDGLRGLLDADLNLVSGDVWIVGEDGVVVRQDGDAIRIDIVGEPLFNRKLCQEPGLFATPIFLRTINNFPPDEYGDFKFEVADSQDAKTVLRVRKTEQGLVIETVGEKLES